MIAHPGQLPQRNSEISRAGIALSCIFPKPGKSTSRCRGPAQERIDVGDLIVTANADGVHRVKLRRGS
jgi:hypothetical protein